MENIADKLKPEAARRAREIAETIVALQVEFAEISLAESVRLSRTPDEAMAVRQSIGEWYGQIVAGNFENAALMMDAPEC
ncbi:MAG: hypothetical protein WCD76_05770 [Pyrinomonadaceae bacterium]